MAGPEIIDERVFVTLLDSLGGDSDFLHELVEAYLTSTPQLLAGMRQAITAGDAAGLQRAAHSLKSGSASLGALAFAAQCREVEDMGKRGALADAEEKVGTLDAAYTEVMAALRTRLDGARSAAA